MYMLHRVGVLFNLTLRICDICRCRSSCLIILIILSASFANILRDIFFYLFMAYAMTYNRNLPYLKYIFPLQRDPIIELCSQHHLN
ncbi:hypothetical protein ALC57_12668 [Trachymyrmex cornetzi]|uniref:Uncharacterized protein n=1 Tax=Trachymyrmex cornetzi TaxID=471704 RepID=A0A195DQK0_9HYME|nr:hypothetical protein ALC57_12668 [Trachymyrmex cornetzi]